jgi:hypothetical protein
MNRFNHVLNGSERLPPASGSPNAVPGAVSRTIEADMKRAALAAALLPCLAFAASFDSGKTLGGTNAHRGRGVQQLRLPALQDDA